MSSTIRRKHPRSRKQGEENDEVKSRGRKKQKIEDGDKKTVRGHARGLSKNHKETSRIKGSSSNPARRRTGSEKGKRRGAPSQYQELNSEVKPTKGRSKKQEEEHEEKLAQHPHKNDPHYAESTKASDFVHEEMHHYKQGKHGNIKNPRQAIAIGLSKARKAGVKVPPKQ